MGKLLRRVRYWLHYRRAASELAEEIESHRAMRQKELERSGLTSKDAAIESRRALGNALLAREEARDVWSWNWLDDAWRDIRASIRDFRKAPSFWIGASLILSLGIGVNMAAFQVCDAVFWKPPEIRDPQSLVRLFRGRVGAFPYLAVPVLEENNNAFSALLIRSDSGTAVPDDIDIHRHLVWGDDSENTPWTSFVSANWFDELGYRPIRGRVFHEGDEDAPDAPPGLVISEVFWKRRLDSDPDIVGKTVRMNNRPATVLGIVPQDVMPYNDTMVWMPLNQVEYFVPGTELKTSWRGPGVQVYARLRPGVSVAAVREAVQAAMSELIRQHPEAFLSREAIDPAPASTRFTAPDRAAERWILSATGLGVTLLIFVIACANLINLVLSRAVGRVRDLSVRVALGASRSRVLRQLLGESALLVFLSSAGGLLLVYWATRIFMIVAADSFPGMPNLELNWRSIFAVLVAVAVAMVTVGLLPAWKISRSDLMTAIKDGGYQTSARLSRTRWRHMFLAAQIGCSCVLLVLTGIILHTLQRRGTDSGFDPAPVAVLTAPLQRQGIKVREALSYWERLRDDMESQPQIAAVALISDSSLEPRRVASDPTLPGPVRYSEVGPGFFEVMKIPILAGRDFDDADLYGTSAILSRQLALRMYGTLDVIGKDFPKDRPRAVVVGIAGDVHFAQDEAEDGAAFYGPLNPENSNRRLVARARTNPASLPPMMRRMALELNNDVIPDAHLLSKDDDWCGQACGMGRLLSVLGLLALSITCVGIFSTVWFAAMLRRPEIGVRMALGAGRKSVILLLAGLVRWPLLVGVALGLTASVPSGRLFTDVSALLKPFDPAVMAIVAAFLTIVSVIAAMLPAWRMLRGNPLQALRSE
jgi:predicted permease